MFGKKITKADFIELIKGLDEDEKGEVMAILTAAKSEEAEEKAEEVAAEVAEETAETETEQAAEAVEEEAESKAKEVEDKVEAKEEGDDKMAELMKQITELSARLKAIEEADNRGGEEIGVDSDMVDDINEVSENYKNKAKEMRF